MNDPQAARVPQIVYTRRTFSENPKPKISFVRKTGAFFLKRNHSSMQTYVQALGVNCGSGVFYHGATAGLEYSF
jgi:hypothetical protein